MFIQWFRQQKWNVRIPSFHFRGRTENSIDWLGSYSFLKIIAKRPFFRCSDKSNQPKAQELSRIWRLRFKNLAGDPQTPEVGHPRVTYDSSEAVPAFQSSFRVQIRQVETSVRVVPNGADACLLRARNVSNALETPTSLPMPPDRFWGDPATTRDTFGNFSDFQFLQFCIGFPSNWLRYALFGFLNRQQPPGELANHSMHPISIIPQLVCSSRDFLFLGIRKIPRKLQETSF